MKYALMVASAFGLIAACLPTETNQMDPLSVVCMVFAAINAYFAGADR